MPQQAWNKKRERQYEHIKDSLKDKGRSERYHLSTSPRARETR